MHNNSQRRPTNTPRSENVNVPNDLWIIPRKPVGMSCYAEVECFRSFAKAKSIVDAHNEGKAKKKHAWSEGLLRPIHFSTEKPSSSEGLSKNAPKSIWAVPKESNTKQGRITLLAFDCKIDAQMVNPAPVRLWQWPAKTSSSG